MSIHEVAAAGYRLAGDDYERARPDYPPAVFSVLEDELRIGPASTVVELGAGTGKFTRLLAPKVGLLVATEPVTQMRSRLAAAVPVPVVGGAAEAVPLRAGCADLVVAATAFHWFRGPDALREAHRLLRPGGGLALVWNNPDRSYDWVARVWGIVDELRGATPGNRDLRWREAFAGASGFTRLTSRSFSHRVTLAVEDLLARVASISFIAALDEPDKNVVLGRVRAIVAGREQVELPYVTQLHWCRRR